MSTSVFDRNAEVVHPPALSLPAWPATPEPADPTGTSYLIVAVGDTEAGQVADRWAHQAEEFAPVDRLAFDTLDAEALAELGHRLEGCRTGVRIMVVGGQCDVLTCLALARSKGAVDEELRSFALHDRDLPMYCAHCRATYRVEGTPGAEVTCPGCARHVEIHSHLSRQRGSFLASDAHAAELP